jgi:large subunit ribosomal protein L30
MAKMLRIKLVKSTIGYNKKQKATADALGLRRINQQVERVDNPQIRGMVNKIIHLVEVEEVEK